VSVYTPEQNLARYRAHITRLTTTYGGIHKIPKSHLSEASERLRAENVVAIAQRDGLNVTKTLRAYFVSQSLIADLGFSTEVPQAKRGQRALEEFVEKHPGVTVTVEELATVGGCTPATVRQFIRTHRSSFTKASTNVWQVIDETAARKESSK
jgi:hypothetical protein